MTGLYNNSMDQFTRDELELGTRVAMALDNEACGFGPLFDLQYDEYVRKDQVNE